MNISKFFIPYCLKPSYLIETRDQAGNCGSIDSLLYSFILTCIIIYFAMKYYKEETNKKYVLYITGSLLVLLWIILPISANYSYRILWSGYDNAKKELIKDGYTKIEVLNILQSFDDKTPLNIGGMLTNGVFAASRKDVDIEKNKDIKAGRLLNIKTQEHEEDIK